VAPFLGRALTPADEDLAAPDVTVLSYDAWQRLFANDRGVIGRAVTLGNKTTTIVGVMPPGFTYPEASNDFWWPWRADAAFRANRDQYMISVVGRLHAGATIEQARTEMATVSARMKRDWPKYNQGNRIAVLPLQDTVVGDIRRQLLVLMGAVGFVLLIACANIGNLLLARASTRRREIAVRRALGAGRSRIVRQLLTESLLLGAAGGVVGLIAGKSLLALLLAAQVTTNLPRAHEIALDARVLVFTFAVSLGAGLLFGSIPAWQLTRGRSSDALREGTRGSGGNQLVRGALVVSELALAMILLTGAGLLLRSFALMARVNPGVETHNVLTFAIGRRKATPTFLPSALDALGALPGVKSVAATSQIPIAGRGIGAWFNRIDRPLPDNVQPTGEAYRVVTPSYFATVGIPLKLGRLPTDGDRREAPAIVVNEALVRKYYAHENPLGKPVYLGAPDNRLFDSAPIVGIVGDTHDAGLDVDPLPTIYIPNGLMPTWPFFSFVIRTSGDPTTIVASARKIVHDLDPAVPIRRVRTLDDILSDAVAPARWSATLLGVFAGVALVMAILGVFGVLSYVVSQRTRELGIRIALGASTSAVRRLVVMRGLSLVAVGLALGVACALGLTRFMASQLYGVTPTDPTTLIGVAALLVSAALVATYVPARRATRVDPIVALRAE
jgi:putative ABC transport system permease protein